jgi:DNA invertase Pin-like site-specific DNA recombinase
MIGAFAEFERNIIRQRQAEGIARAKARGVYKGRKKTIDTTSIRNMNAEGHSVTEIAALLGVSRMTVYRSLKLIGS